MNEKALIDSWNIAEQMGFQRGTLTILKQLLEEMEKNNSTAISYKSIKQLFEEFQKPEHRVLPPTTTNSENK